MSLPRLAHATALVASLLLLGACERQVSSTPAATKLSVVDLKLPADRFPGIVEIITKSEVVDDYPLDGEVPGMITTLRRIGVSSSAYYRYLVEVGDGRRLIKVKINVFDSTATAARDFAQRYGEEFRRDATELALGDEGLNRDDNHYAFRVDHVQIEVRLKDNLALLNAFAKEYEAFAGERLGRQ